MKKVLGKHELVDPKTGECHDVITLIPEKRDRGFVKVFKPLTVKVMEDIPKGMSLGAVAVLMYIFDELQDIPVGGEPMIRLDPADIAKKLGKCASGVRAYISDLRKHGYIEQCDSRGKWYRIPPEMVYRGKVCEYFDRKTREAA